MTTCGERKLVTTRLFDAAMHTLDCDATSLVSATALYRVPRTQVRDCALAVNGGSRLCRKM
jgi:hypothetical protein